LSYYRQRALQYQDHAATLQGYLAHYQGIEWKVMEDHGVDVLTPELKEIVAEKRIDAFDAFTCYILLTCSPKMRSRDKHSISQKYFDCLCLITEAELKSALPKNEIAINEPTRTRDIPLCDALLASDVVFKVLTAYIRIQFPDLPLEFEFGTLRSAFERLRKFHNSGERDMSKCPSLYTKDTAVEFHYLLVTALAGYKAALKCFGSPTDENNVRYTPEHYNHAYMFVHLVWRIAHSSILREHLAFLHTARLLFIEDGSAPGGGSQHVSEKGAATETVDEVTDLEGSDVVEQEMTATMLHTSLASDGSRDLGIAILRWLRLLVSPITAVETMSLSCMRIQHGCSIRIQLVDLAPVKCAQFEWKPVMRRALGLHADLKDIIPAVIAVIEERTKAGLGPAKNTQLRHFGHQASETEKGVPHCEVVAACLISFLERAIPVKGRALELAVYLFHLLK
jgi:hypothetical protein